MVLYNDYNASGARIATTELVYLSQQGHHGEKSKVLWETSLDYGLTSLGILGHTHSTDTVARKYGNEQQQPRAIWFRE